MYSYFLVINYMIIMNVIETFISKIRRTITESKNVLIKDTADNK